MSEPLVSEADPRRRVRARVLVLFLIGLAAAGLIAWRQARENARFVHSRVERQTKQLASQLLASLRLYEFGLRGSRGTIAALGEQRVTRQAFSEHWRSRDIEREFPGARGFGFIRRVAVADEAAFLEAARRDGMPTFSIRQLAPNAGERWVIQYIEPTQRNSEALGLDIASEVNRRHAAETAMRSDAATLTGPITLVQATGLRERSFLFLLPVYRSDMPRRTPSERHAAAFGFTYAPLVIDEIVRRIAYPGLALAISDVTPGSRATRFYVSSPIERANDDELTHAFEQTVYGRTWRVEVRAGPRFVADLHLVKPTQALALGLLTVLLAAALLHAYLVSRERKFQVLSQQARLSALVESSSDAIVSESLDGRIVSWNKAAEQIFGWPAAAAIGMDATRLGLDVAHDADELRLTKVREGATLAAVDTVRRRRDGSLVDVSIAASPLRSSDGQIVGIAKTIRDISGRKAGERQLQEFTTKLEQQVAERTAQLEGARHDLQTILDAMPSMVGYWDKDGFNRFANWAYHRWFGVDPGKMPGMHIRTLLGEALYERNRPYIEGALRGEPQHFERAIPRPDGEGVRHSLAHYLPDVRDGEVRGFYVLVHDVSELTESRQKLTAALRENALERERLDNILKGTNVGTWEWNVQTGEARFNERWAEIIGYSLRDLMPVTIETWARYAHPEDLAHSNALLEQHFAGQLDYYECECRMKHRDGHWVWVLDRGRVSTWTQEGKPEWMYGTHQDITTNKEAQRRLTESEAFLERAGRVAGVGGWQLDLGSGELTWTAQIRRIAEVPDDYRPTQEEALDLYAPEAQPIVRRAVQAAIETGEGWDLELPFVTARGKHRWVRTVGEVLTDNEKVSKLVGSLQDVTDRHQAGEALREATLAAEAASAAKSAFLANMSHEIRSPLNAVIGLAHLLEDTRLEPKQREYLDSIRAASRSLLAVIDDILDLSKIEAHEMKLESAPFELPALVEDVRAMLAPQAELKRLMLRTQLAADAPRWLRGDVTRVRQILTNLVSNAIKFTEQGYVELSVAWLAHAQGKAHLRCAVRDTGIGIESEALSRLFTPFTQADSSTTRRFGGTGLGLSIVKRLATLMGGEVGVQSEFGEGSEFWVTLPLEVHEELGSSGLSASDAEASSLPAVSSALTGGSLHGVHVLVVDDSEVNREVVRGLLERAGATVSACANGQEVLELLRRAPAGFDMVLMDVQMPIMDGNEATRRLREELGLSALPVIALTAGALSGERQRALDAGMNDFLSKPLEPELLIRTVRRHIAQARATALTEPLGRRLTSDVGPAFPRVEGIDAEKAAERFQHDAERFTRLLGMFVREYTDWQWTEPPPLHDAQARDDLATRAHKLRGAAGTMGADRIAQLARAVEAAQQHEREDPTLPSTLRELQAALSALAESARPLLAAASRTSPRDDSPSSKRSA